MKYELKITAEDFGELCIMRRHLDGTEAFAALNEFKDALRSLYKHTDLDEKYETKDELLEKIRDLFNECCGDTDI